MQTQLSSRQIYSRLPRCICMANAAVRSVMHAARARQVTAPCVGGAAAPKYNPQNVEDSVVGPNQAFTPLEAVHSQLKACAQNDEPWTNHGIQTMYEFAEDAGGMERSYYFVTFQKDLYHFDHFMGGFATRLGALVDCGDWKVVDERPDCPTPGQVQGLQAETLDAFADGLVAEELCLQQLLSATHPPVHEQLGALESFLHVQVDVQVQTASGEDAGVYTFTLVQREFGKKKGCWMTKSLGKKDA